MIKLKESLLNTTFVQDNVYLEKYIQLLEDNKSRTYVEGETQRHHIIPRAYYQHNNLSVSARRLVTLVTR